MVDLSKIEKFFAERIDLMDSDNAPKTFYFILISRKKWLDVFYPGVSGIRGGEYAFSKFVLAGHAFDIYQKVKHKLSILDPRYSFERFGFNIADFYAKYPKAVSLMVTYQPRDEERAVKKLTLELISRLINHEEPIFLDNLWKTIIHKTPYKGLAFVLIDLDVFKPLSKQELKYVADVYRDLGIMDIYYACTTPSGGLHTVVRLDLNRAIGEIIFGRHKEFKNRLLKVSKSIKEIEIKTQQVLTHIPGVNPNVVDVTDLFETRRPLKIER